MHTYDAPDGAYGAAGAVALGVGPERMLKTLLADLDGELVCARRGLSVELAPADLVHLTDAVVADVAR